MRAPHNNSMAFCQWISGGPGVATLRNHVRRLIGAPNRPIVQRHLVQIARSTLGRRVGDRLPVKKQQRRFSVEPTSGPPSAPLRPGYVAAEWHPGSVGGVDGMEVEIRATADGAQPHAPPTTIIDSAQMVTVRVEEVVLVALVLLIWVGAIALFFNRWGKIRMLEPYQPKFHQQPHRPSCPLAPLGSPTGPHPLSNSLPRAQKIMPQRMSFSKYNVNALTDPLSILPSPIIKRPRRSSVFVGSSQVLNGTPRRAKSATDIHYVGAMDPRSSTSLTGSIVRRPSLATERPIFISRRRPSTTIEKAHFHPKPRRASCFVDRAMGAPHRLFNSFEAAASRPSGLAVPVKGRSCGSFVQPTISFEMARPKVSRSFEQPPINRAKPERMAVSLDVAGSFNEPLLEVLASRE